MNHPPCLTPLEKSLFESQRKLVRDLAKARASLREAYRQLAERTNTELEAFERGLETGRTWSAAESGRE